jgi:hypothetical protein
VEEYAVEAEREENARMPMPGGDDERAWEAYFAMCTQVWWRISSRAAEAIENGTCAVWTEPLRPLTWAYG